MTLPKHLLCAVVASATAACASLPIAPAPTPVTAPPTPLAGTVDPVPLDPARGAVLPPDKALELTRQCSRISPGPVVTTWDIDRAAIADLESRLGAELARQFAAQSGTAAPADYYRQYAGFIIGGRRVIYINGIASSAADRSGQNWRTDPAILCDGGALSFGVEYDPATQAFTNFAFNGQY